ncbi:hypothetical protein, partial [Streptomyces sp. NPDC020667]|uniref:hypothetical protein n=1 Tax=Streptomyces sp. NPDC020667 TaxID=3154895 RepID=UPI0033CFF140
MTDVVREMNQAAPTPSNTRLRCVKETKVNGWSYTHVTDEARKAYVKVPFGDMQYPVAGMWTVDAPSYTDVNSGVMVRPGESLVWMSLNSPGQPVGAPVQFVLNLPVTSQAGQEPSRPTMTGYGKPAEKTPEVEDFRVTVPCLAVQ